MSALDAAAAALRDQVGRIARVDIPPIDALWASRFAVACGEHDPVFHDGDAARAAGHRAQPLPPLLLSATRSWSAAPDIAADGTTLGDVGFPTGHAVRTLGGGQRLAWHATDDPVVGEAMTVESQVLDVTERSAGSGDLLVVAIERRFLGPDGDVLLTCNEDRLMR